MQSEERRITKIFIICDYRNQFYFSSKKKGSSLNTDKIKTFLEKYFSEVIVTSFAEIKNFDVFKQAYVLYHTSEDPGLLYKDYIEDIILTIKNYGGILIPNFHLFRAHHNKVFSDLYLKFLGIENIKSFSYGTFEEYFKDLSSNLFDKEIYIFKTAHSTKSSGVKMINSFFKKISIPYFYSLSFTLDNFKRKFIDFIFKSGYTRQSNNRKKFLIQDYKYSKNGDYRIIIYGKHYYVLHRYNRKNDFRASGSGIFYFDTELPNGLLNYAEKLFIDFNCAYIAFDVGICNDEFVLYEYQAISMGQYAAENAPHYFFKKDDMWKVSKEKISIEEELAESIKLFLNI